MQTDAVHFYSVFWKLEPKYWEKYSDDDVCVDVDIPDR